MLLLGAIAGIIFGIEIVSLGMALVYFGAHLMTKSYVTLMNYVIDYVMEKRKK